MGFLGGSAGKESACNAGDTSSIPGWGRSTRKMDRLPTPVSLDFLGGSAGKESACNAEDLGLIPGQDTKVPHAVCGVANKKWVFFSFQLSKSEKLKLILK